METKSLSIGLIIGLILAGTIGYAILGQTKSWQFRKTQMLVNQAFQVALPIIMIFVRSAFIFACLLFLWGACVSLSYTNSVFHGVSGSTKRSLRMAIHESILTIGLIVGATVGGVLYQSFSMTIVLLFCACALAVGTVAQALVMVFKK